MEAKELEKVVETIESKLAEAVEKYDGQVKEAGSVANEVRDEVRALSEEHKSAVEKSEDLQSRLQELEQKAAEGFKQGNPQQRKNWGESLTESKSFESFKSGNTTKARVEVKNTILGEGGSPQDPQDTIVQTDRLPGIVPGAFRALNLLDFIPMGTTSSNQLEYTRELSWTNDAAEVAEGGEKAESDLTFELVSDPVRTIAHWIRVSKQVLDDAPALASYIDRRLRHGVNHRLQEQILTGNGTSPNIQGLTATGRHTDFTPVTGENALDSVNRAKYAVIGADYSPNFVLLNPSDWGAIERLKRASSDDSYVASDGAALSYINNGMTALLWGLPVVMSNDMTATEFIVADSNAMQLFMRQSVMVEMSDSDDDNFTKNLLTIRAELRAALAVFVPAAVRYGSLTQ